MVVGGDDSFSEIGWAFAGVFQEAAVELGQGAKSDIKGDFTDAGVAAGEAFFGLEDTFPVVKFSERSAGACFENAAQMVSADARDFRDVGQREWFIESAAEVVANAFDGLREFVSRRDRLAFQFAGQLHGEDNQHFDDGVVMFIVDHLASEVGFLQILHIALAKLWFLPKDFQSPFEIFLTGDFCENLPCAQMADEGFPEPDGNGCFPEVGEAFDGVRFRAVGYAQTDMGHFAGFAVVMVGVYRPAERIARLAGARVVVPGKPEGEPCSFAEGAGISVIRIAAEEAIKQFCVAGE